MRNSHIDSALGEVDLFELLRGLLGQKKIIFGVALLFVLVAGGYAYTVNPVYEATINVQPPSKNDIANFNYGRNQFSGLAPFSVADVYSTFLAKLNSEELRRSFFTSVYLPSLGKSGRDVAQDKLYEKFSKTISILARGKDFPDRYSVVVQNESADEAATWAKNYVSAAGELARQEMIANATKEAEVIARNLEQQLISLREEGVQRRGDTIKRLDEALNIAKAIDLERPLIIASGKSVEMTARMDDDLTYLRGTKALEAEVKNLDSRKSDDPFIRGLRELQGKYRFYKDIEVKPMSVSVYSLDGDVEKTDMPVKPKKVLILLMGGLSGLLAGAGIAFFRFFWARNIDI